MDNKLLKFTDEEIAALKEIGFITDNQTKFIKRFYTGNNYGGVYGFRVAWKQSDEFPNCAIIKRRGIDSSGYENDNIVFEFETFSQRSQNDKKHYGLCSQSDRNYYFQFYKNYTWLSENIEGAIKSYTREKNK